jgi:hypothetical protein
MTELSFYEAYLEGKRRQDEIAKRAQATWEAGDDKEPGKVYAKFITRQKRRQRDYTKAALAANRQRADDQAARDAAKRKKTQ